MLFMSRKNKPHKVILIGDAAVGKTTLRKNFMGESTTGQYLMTIGADFSIKKIDVDGEEHILQIWDLAGQKQFGSVIDGYFKGTKGILLVFALNSADTFNNLLSWLDEYIKAGNEIVPVIILGNKSDLPDRAIERSQVEELMKEMKNKFEEPTFYVNYFETNALEGVNVVEAFDDIVKIMIENEMHFS